MQLQLQLRDTVRFFFFFFLFRLSVVVLPHHGHNTHIPCSPFLQSKARKRLGTSAQKKKKVWRDNPQQNEHWCCIRSATNVTLIIEFDEQCLKSLSFPFPRLKLLLWWCYPHPRSNCALESHATSLRFIFRNLQHIILPSTSGEKGKRGRLGLFTSRP